jgi:hypothetical protein
MAARLYVEAWIGGVSKARAAISSFLKIELAFPSGNHGLYAAEKSVVACRNTSTFFNKNVQDKRRAATMPLGISMSTPPI